MRSQSASLSYLKSPIAFQKGDLADTDEVDMDATAREIRGELDRRHGTMLSFDDKMIVLRAFSNLTMSTERLKRKWCCFVTNFA